VQILRRVTSSHSISVPLFLGDLDKRDPIP
jgi:hypothetical protein